MTVASDRKDVRINNQILILETIKKFGRMSRAEVSKAIHLSAPSVSTNVDKLLELGLLREVGEGKSATGRKPIMLEIVEDYRVVAAVDLSSDPVDVALSDLHGNLIDQCLVMVNGDVITQDTFQSTIYALHTLLRRHRVTTDKLYKIGIAAPGVIDEETGFYINAPRIANYRSVNLRKMFSEEFAAEVVVKNDTNLAALGEWHHGGLEDSRNLIYILADSGIGAGLMLNNHVYHGSHGTAGDIGYLLASFAGCDDQLFDSIGSGYAILKAATKELREKEPEVLASFAVPEGKHLDFVQFRKLLDARNVICCEILKQAVAVWGKVLMNICVLLDLDTVVVGGRLAYWEDEFLSPVCAFVNTNMPFRVKIVPSKLDGNAALTGAVSTILEDVFSNLVSD